MSDLNFPVPGNLPPEDPEAAADRRADIGLGTTSAGEGTGLGGLSTSAQAGATDNGTGAGQGTGAAGPGTTAGGGDTFGPPEVSSVGSGYGGQVSSAGPTGVPDATREAAATTLDGGMADVNAGAGLAEGEWQPEEAGMGVEPPELPSGMQRAEPQARPDSTAEPEGWYSEGEDDVVDDASMDSFPASDPPSYSPHRS